jgi:hypothetical protein
MIDLTLDLENYFPTPRRNLNATKFFVLLPIPCNVITFEKEWESFGVTAVVIKGCVGIFRSTQPGEGLDASYTNKFFLCSEGSVGVHRLSECIIGALIIQREQFWLHITSQESPRWINSYHHQKELSLSLLKSQLRLVL